MFTDPRRVWPLTPCHTVAARHQMRCSCLRTGTRTAMTKTLISLIEIELVLRKWWETGRSRIGCRNAHRTSGSRRMSVPRARLFPVGQVPPSTRGQDPPASSGGGRSLTLGFAGPSWQLPDLGSRDSVVMISSARGVRRGYGLFGEVAALGDGSLH